MSGKGGCVWFQKVINMKSRSRGCHLVTEEIQQALPELQSVDIGVLHLCSTMSSAYIGQHYFKRKLGLECEVKTDAEMMLNHLVPENFGFRHVCEGPDDMPAHIKTAFIGPTLCIPITRGQLNLGTWQGIWLCEHRNHGGMINGFPPRFIRSRNIVATIQGKPVD